MRVRRPGAVLQGVYSVALVTTQPLVSGPPAHSEVAAQIAEAGLVLQIGGDELPTFGHPVGPGPGHRAILLRSRRMPARCYPCSRSELLPVCPVRTVRIYLTAFAHCTDTRRRMRCTCMRQAAWDVR